jgi:DNA primase
VVDEKVAEVRERTDIVALIGEHVALKRAGGQFKGLCPFHAEKTPSFFVHPLRQWYHCFGCGTSGDCFTFVMKLEGCSFPEALRFLAERAGIELRAEDEREEIAFRQARLERDRLLAVADAAAGFFVRMLYEHPLGAIARAALRARGVSEETARTFRLGYAPHGWDHLARYLAEKGFSPRDAELAGVLVPRGNRPGHYDRFRHRLVFPIADVHGRIVAFSGRILDPPPDDPPRPGQDPPAKYINSPEGPLYRKGELLFGIHEARVHLRREGVALVCEGNFDVLALHQAGCKNVVAPLGTAFTAMQCKLLRRYVNAVTLVFDSDRAGRDAVAAAFPLLTAEGLAARVATLPPGEDPDSFLRARGPQALRERVAAALPIVQHLIESAAAEAGADPAARARAIEALGPVLAAVPSPVERQLWVERVGQAFGIADLQAVRRELSRGARLAPRVPSRQRAPGTAAAPQAGPPARSNAPPSWSALDPLEKDAVAACLDQPALLSSSEAEHLDTLLTSGDLRVILRTAARMVEMRGVVDASALVAAIGEGPARAWLEERLSVQTFDDEAGAKSFLGTALRLLHRRRIEREIRALDPRIREALREGDTERATELIRRRDELYRQGGAS